VDLLQMGWLSVTKMTVRMPQQSLNSRIVQKIISNVDQASAYQLDTDATEMTIAVMRTVVMKKVALANQTNAVAATSVAEMAPASVSQ